MSLVLYNFLYEQVHSVVDGETMKKSGDTKVKIQLPVSQLEAFCQRHHIYRLAFFGSVLRDDFGPDSDVDVLVEFEPGTKVGLRFFTLEQELSDLLGRRVDLNTYGFLSPYFRDQALAEAETFYVAA